MTRRVYAYPCGEAIRDAIEPVGYQAWLRALHNVRWQRPGAVPTMQCELCLACGCCACAHAHSGHCIALEKRVGKTGA
jgi:hypothetical protein